MSRAGAVREKVAVPSVVAPSDVNIATREKEFKASLVGLCKNFGHSSTLRQMLADLILPLYHLELVGPKGKLVLEALSGKMVRCGGYFFRNARTRRVQAPPVLHLVDSIDSVSTILFPTAWAKAAAGPRLLKALDAMSEALLYLPTVTSYVEFIIANDGEPIHVILDKLRESLMANGLPKMEQDGDTEPDTSETEKEEEGENGAVCGAVANQSQTSKSCDVGTSTMCDTDKIAVLRENLDRARRNRENAVAAEQRCVDALFTALYDAAI